MQLGEPEKKLVWIVDDEPDILKLIRISLEAGGFAVESFSAGTEVIARAKNGTTPQLIFLDIMMPFLNGFDVCRQIRADNRFANVPVAFLTAKNQGRDYLEGLAAGGTSYIEKPFEIDQLPILATRLIKKGHP